MQVVAKLPYFNEPFYVGFNVGGYELGLLPPGDKDVRDGSTVYWSTADIEAEHAQLLKLDARAHSSINDVGAGIKVATLLDLSGNIIGIIENPHFKLDYGG